MKELAAVLAKGIQFGFAVMLVGLLLGFGFVFAIWIFGTVTCNH